MHAVTHGQLAMSAAAAMVAHYNGSSQDKVNIVCWFKNNTCSICEKRVILPSTVLHLFLAPVIFERHAGSARNPHRLCRRASSYRESHALRTP
jgi:hypothetical protein